MNRQQRGDAQEEHEVARLREALRPFAACARAIRKTEFFLNDDPRKPSLDTPVSMLVQPLGDPITIGAVFDAQDALDSAQDSALTSVGDASANASCDLAD